MPLFFQKAPTILGLDISSTAVKLLELSRSGDCYKVESYAVEPLAAGAVVEKNIVNIEAVGAGISRAVKRARTRAKNAAVAVSGSAVITKTIYMPAGLTDEEMATQIELEASQYIPYPLEDVNLDFQVLGPAPRDPNMVEVFLAASRSENVDSRVAAIELGGLTTKVVDIEAYAAEHLISLLGQALPKGANQVIAVVDLGATTSRIHVLDKLKLVYSREQSFGNKQLIEAMQSHYGLSPEETSKAIRQGGGGLPADYASGVLEPFKEAVAQHVSRSLQFFLSSSPYHNMDHILLAGGTALLPGLAALVESTTGTPTSVANPFTGMTLASQIDAKALKSDAPILLTACGLAMRSFRGMNTRINLLPWREARRKESERQFMSIGIGAVVLAGVIIAYAHIHIGALISNQEGRNQILNQEIAQLDTKIKEIRSLDTQRSNLLARMNIIQQLQTSRPLTVHLMDELIKNLPEGVYYTSAKMQGNALTLEGIAQSNARVSALMKNLDDSPWLENPVLNVIETNEKDKVRTTRYTLRVTQTQPGQENQSKESAKADQAAKP